MIRLLICLTVDSIGLLVPSARTDAGYRLYSDDDLLRLQQIVIGRALGLSLEEIRRSLDDPRFDRRAALLEQKARLGERARETESMMRGGSVRDTAAAHPVPSVSFQSDVPAC